MGTRLVMAAAVIAAAVALPSVAQEKYPSKPIELIVPWGPGGGADVLGRTVARWLEADFKSPVPVINMPGATGMIGVGKITTNAPDGHTVAVLMLDESIYDESDIEQAATERAAAFVKVKLMKFVSLDRLAAALRRIAALQMTPVLGNGVASDIGCWMEACLAAECIDTAGEMNGWLKQRSSLLRNPLTVSQGTIRIPAGYTPQRDAAAVEAATIGKWGRRR